MLSYLKTLNYPYDSVFAHLLLVSIVSLAINAFISLIIIAANYFELMNS